MALNVEKQSIESHENVCMVLESEMITLVLSENYDSNISRQLLNSFKYLSLIYMFWSSVALIPQINAPVQRQRKVN